LAARLSAMAGNVPRSLARQSKLLAEQVRTRGEDDCPSAARLSGSRETPSGDGPLSRLQVRKAAFGMMRRIDDPESLARPLKLTVARSLCSLAGSSAREPIGQRRGRPVDGLMEQDVVETARQLNW
jgi:hypothetical protein